MLRSEPWHLAGAADGTSVMELVHSYTADVLLLDSKLVGISGFDVCRRLRSDDRHRFLPIVLISAYDDVTSRVAALEAGADDFLSRPLEKSELIARVRSLLRVKSMHDRLEDTRQVIMALAKAAEAKDRFTVQHAERVAQDACMLGRCVGLGSEVLGQLQVGALIHDVGKIAVPDCVLNKSAELTEAEMEKVRRHPVVGAEIVAPLSGQPELLAIVRNHHERYDGKGYPDHLAGTDIPLTARIVAICDAYDAMTNQRPYRPAMTRQRAAELLRAGRDTQWDGGLVDTYLHAKEGGA